MLVVPDIRIAPDSRQWAHDGAQLLLELTDRAISARSRCLIVLSGGSTPKTLYGTLSSPPWNRRFDWERMEFFFGDERCVPPDHPDSNYKTASTTLFHPLGLGTEHVHRMEGEGPNVASAALRYEQTIRTITNCRPPQWPQMDVVLLGLGDDGHTASLFPGTAALAERHRLVTVGQAPQGVASRLTLTLGVINRASVVLFLVMGANKAQIVCRLLEPRTDADRQLPAALVQPDGGRFIWLLDRPAASALTFAN